MGIYSVWNLASQTLVENRPLDEGHVGKKWTAIKSAGGGAEKLDSAALDFLPNTVVRVFDFVPLTGHRLHMERGGSR